MDSNSLESIRFLSTQTLEDLLHQMKVDTTRFEDDILKIEQELLIRNVLPYCRPVIDLV